MELLVTKTKKLGNPRTISNCKQHCPCSTHYGRLA